MIKESDVCSGDALKDVHLPWCLGFTDAKLMCEKFRGQLSTITSSKIQKGLFETLREIANYSVGCDYRSVWTGFSDSIVEGDFIDVNHGTMLKSLTDFDPFVIGQPNGHTEQNCVWAYFDMPHEKPCWFDDPCDVKVHSFCKIRMNPMFQIRGKLKESNVKYCGINNGCFRTKQ